MGGAVGQIGAGGLSGGQCQGGADVCSQGSDVVACGVGHRFFRSNEALYIVGPDSVISRIDHLGLVPLASTLYDVRQIEEPYFYYVGVGTETVGTYGEPALMRGRLDGTGAPEVFWDCRAPYMVVLDATSIFTWTFDALVRLDKPGAPSASILTRSTDAQFAADENSFYWVQPDGRFVVHDKTGPACSCTCNVSTLDSGDQNGAGAASGGQVSGAAGGPQSPKCVSPPRPDATSGLEPRPEALANVCLGDGVTRGTTLQSGVGFLYPQLSQDATNLYVGDKSQFLYRVPKNGEPALQLFSGEWVEAFVVDGPYVYAAVTDGPASVVHDIHRQLVRVNKDGSGRTTVGTLPVYNGGINSGDLRVADLAIADGSVYYVLYDNCGAGLHRLPL